MPGVLAIRTAALLSFAALAGGCAPVAVAAGAPPPAPLLGPAQQQQVGPDSVTMLRSGAASFAQLRLLIDDARISVHVGCTSSTIRRSWTRCSVRMRAASMSL